MQPGLASNLAVLWIRSPRVGTIGMHHHAVLSASFITSVTASVALSPHLCKMGVLGSTPGESKLRKARNEASPRSHG